MSRSVMQWRERACQFQDGKWKLEALLSSTIINKNSSPTSHPRSRPILGRALDTSWILSGSGVLALCIWQGRQGRQGQGLREEAPRMPQLRRPSSPQSPVHVGPMGQVRRRNCVCTNCKGFGHDKPNCPSPGRPNMYVQPQEILKVRAKQRQRLQGQRKKARARVNTFLVRDPGMCRCLTQRDIMRRIGVRGKDQMNQQHQTQQVAQSAAVNSYAHADTMSAPKNQ